MTTSIAPQSWTQRLIWLAVAITGASAAGGIALNRGESINAIWFIVAAVCTYLIGYRFYSAWIAAKVLMLDKPSAGTAEAKKAVLKNCGFIKIINSI